MIKWRADGVGIRPVEVERETGASVWINGRRHTRYGPVYQYHDTWAEAHAWLMSQAQDRVIQCRRQLELANARLGNIKGMPQGDV